MRSTILGLFFTLSIFFTASGQDVIIKQNGQEINGKIIRITDTEVRYSRADSALAIPKAQVFMVKYADGSKTVFKSENTALKPAITQDQTSQLHNDVLFIRGRTEAELYYKGNKGLNTITLISTVLAPPVGLASAVATTIIPPSRRQLRLPDATLYAKQPYADGYRRKAGKIKANKVWTNFGIGCGIFGFAYFSISRYAKK